MFQKLEESLRGVCFSNLTALNNAVSQPIYELNSGKMLNGIQQLLESGLALAASSNYLLSSNLSMRRECWNVDMSQMSRKLEKSKKKLHVSILKVNSLHFNMSTLHINVNLHSTLSTLPRMLAPCYWKPGRLYRTVENKFLSILYITFGTTLWWIKDLLNSMNG